ncbi:unnamed protein product [Mycena citricolor]|uniref:F-box domain-containing protein n=1 Tax=Mycena citricolor TaxID=2018698 RepID=A0AAD2HQI8_9AGAR|nr:unnamed protein product [Mycena citricolor]CAK5278983.1 unnamed protein product [Mycena citricolor]
MSQSHSAFLKPLPGIHFSDISVPFDTLDHILCALPDFASLHAASGVCRAWAHVFKTRRASILRAVAENVVGGDGGGVALGAAVRRVRYPVPEKEDNMWGLEDEEGREGNDGEDEDEEKTEDDTDEDDEIDVNHNLRKKAVIQPPTENDSIGQPPVQPICSMARSVPRSLWPIVLTLFLRVAKETAAPHIVLPGAQRSRFYASVYRIMLYREVFYLPVNLDDIDAMEEEPAFLDRTRKERHDFLAAYTTSDLLDMRAVHAFMYDIIRDVVAEEHDSGVEEEFERLKDICIAAGPAAVLKAHQDLALAPFEEAHEVEVLSSGENNAFFGGFITAPLTAILRDERHVPNSAVPWETFEGTLSAEDDFCSQCKVVAPLWSSKNWHRLIAVDLLALLPGKLNENDVEAEAILQILMHDKAHSRVDARTLVAEIFDLDERKKRADQCICLDCLHSIVGKYLVGWVYQRKVLGGWTPTGNCWYGWNCKTQVHKRDHARKMNVPPVRAVSVKIVMI